MENDPRYFVWLVSPTSTMPQLWYGDQTDGAGRFKHGATGEKNLLFFHELTPEEYKMPLNELREKYPCPAPTLS
jgi:hypothetical protein